MTAEKAALFDANVPGGGVDLFTLIATWLELDFPSSREPVLTNETSSANHDKCLPKLAESSYRHAARSTDRSADQGHQEVQCLPPTTNC
jgi:hypothetical protein